MKRTIYYVIKNAGDGSAYVDYYKTRELAAFIDREEAEDEGFAESALGSLIIEATGDVDSIIVSDVEDEIEVIFSRYYHNFTYDLNDLEDDSKIFDYLYEFFREGLPEIVIDEEDKNYVFFKHNGRVVHKQFKYGKNKTIKTVAAHYDKFKKKVAAIMKDFRKED